MDSDVTTVTHWTNFDTKELVKTTVGQVRGKLAEVLSTDNVSGSILTIRVLDSNIKLQIHKDNVDVVEE